MRGKSQFYKFKKRREKDSKVLESNDLSIFNLVKDST